MNFEEVDDVELRAQVRKFAEARVGPIARTLDHHDAEVPTDLIREMGEMGFFGICVSDRFGGAGLPARALCVITEELARQSLSVASLIQRNVACGRILELHGTDEQRERWLDGIASGRLLCSSAATEPEAGSDAANIRTSATLSPAGDEYEINGSKQWITFANQAHLLFTYVRTDRSQKHRGISLIVIEKEPGDGFVPGLTGTQIETSGYHGMKTFSLDLNGLSVSADNLVGGTPGRGFQQMMAVYEIARIGFAFRCTGLALAALDRATEHATARVQFGRPIGDFQAVRFRIADMATEIEAARQLGFQAARTYDAGDPSDVLAGMAKLFASEVAHRVCWNALYIHGGMGYATETDVNRYWRDSALLPIGEGTSDIQREVIARSLVGRGTPE